MTAQDTAKVVISRCQRRFVMAQKIPKAVGFRDNSS